MMEMKSAGMKTTDRKVTEPAITGGLADVSVERVNAQKSSVFVGKEKLIDIVFSPDGKFAIYKVKNKQKWICVDAKILMLKLLDLLAA